MWGSNRLGKEHVVENITDRDMANRLAMAIDDKGLIRFGCDHLRNQLLNGMAILDQHQSTLMVCTCITTEIHESNQR